MKLHMVSLLLNRRANLLRQEKNAAEKARAEASYGPMCRDPKLCAGKGYCPRNPTCGD